MLTLNELNAMSKGALIAGIADRIEIIDGSANISTRLNARTEKRAMENRLNIKEYIDAHANEPCDD